MAAPRGNKFWMLRSKHGREKLFASPELLWDAACEYFEWCEKNPFIEVEQVKSPARPYKNEKGKWVKSPTTINLPRMRPYTLEGLCLYLDCNTAYFRQFRKALADKTDEESNNFSTVVTRIEEVIYNQKYSGAAAGFFNSNIIARDLGLVDKKEQSVIVEQPLFSDDNP